MGQITRVGKPISKLIAELEQIKNEHGDIFCYHDRFHELVDASVELAFVREPKDKREIRKFWDRYNHKEEDKGEKCVKVW